MERMEWLPGGSVKLNGEIGKALDNCVRNRLCTIDYKRLTDVFLNRNEADNRWRCEFWGKNIRGAILACNLTGNKTLFEIVKNSVNDMLAAQTTDGCLSSYPPDRQLNAWDIWGRKYAIIGLMRYYELLEKDERIPQACVRVLDNLFTQMNGREMREFGEHEGLAACSILGAIVMVYRATRLPRILDYAVKIVESGCSKRHNVFQEALKGTRPRDIGNAKAYELSSCFQGLAQLQEFMANEKWHDVVFRYLELVAENEQMVTGMFGCGDDWGEYWHDGASNQTSTDCRQTGTLGETCIITTWLHYCNELLKLDGNPRAALLIQRTAWNAMLGAMNVSGEFWTHQNPTPLAASACKKPSMDQMFVCEGVPFDGHDCCRSQGPEGVAMMAAMAVMRSVATGAWHVNLFEDMTAPCFQISGGCPFAGDEAVVVITQTMESPLCLLMTDWVKAVELDGQPVDFQRGKYLELTGLKKGSVVKVAFDMTPKPVFKDGFVSLSCGPLTLAQESGLGKVGEPLLDFDFSRIPSRDGYRALFENRHGQLLCDYASADRCLSPDVTLQVWLPFVAS